MITMYMAKSFEELHIRQKSKELYHLTSTISKNRKQYFLKDQLLRATLSISNNIAEWFERQTTKELVRFLYIAKGSCGEVRSMLHIIHDEAMIDTEIYTKLSSLAQQISVMTHKFIQSIYKDSS
jgi:four helix bundle protein